MRVTVLGPQRRNSTARAAVAELIPTGQVATINAGWREREADDAELAGALGGRMINLRLYRRWTQLWEDDPQYAAAERDLLDDLSEQQAVYAIRLRHAVAALEEIYRQDKLPSVRAGALADGVRQVRALDSWHLQQVAGLRQQFYRQVEIGDRNSIRVQRRQLAELVDNASGMVIAGGHVGVLLHLLHIFGLSAMLKPPLITWSAGAMAVSDRVVLFGANRSTGRQLPEMWAEGLGAYPGMLPFPQPRQRLPMADPAKLALLALRFPEWTCLLVDPGARLDLGESWPPPAGARWLTKTGAVRTRTAGNITLERPGLAGPDAWLADPGAGPETAGGQEVGGQPGPVEQGSRSDPADGADAAGGHPASVDRVDLAWRWRP